MNTILSFSNGIIKYLNISVFFAMLATVLWGLNKGFDVTDEGYYVLGYQPGQEIGFGASGFQQLIKGLFSWMTLDVVNLRILRLLFCLLSTFLLTIGLKYYLDKKYSNLHVFSILGIGALLSYTYGPQSLSYNSLIASFLLMSFTLVLIGLNKKGNYSTVIFLFSGLLLAFGLIVKFPPVLVYLVCLGLFFISYKKWTHKKKFYAIVKLLIGFVLGLLLFSVFCVSIFDFYDDVSRGISFLSSSGSNHTLQSLFGNVGELLVLVLTFLGSFFLLLIFNRFLNKRIKSSSKIDLFLIFLFLGIVFFFCFQNIIDLISVNTSFLLFITTLFIVYAFSNFNVLNKHSRIVVVLMVFLFLLPFIGSLGTNNSLLFNTGFMLSCWLALILLVIDKSLNNQLFVNVVYVVLITVSSYLFVNQYINHPYRINSLHSQTESIPNERVKLDVQSADFISKLEAILKKNNFEKGDPIVGLYKMPGLVYLLGGKSPGGILSLWDKNRTNQFLAELKESSIDYSTSYFLIKNRYADSLVIGLNTLGVKFPNDYVNVGSVSIPVNFHNGGVCYVYAHNSKVDANIEIIKEQLQKALAFLNSGDFSQSIQWYEKVLANDSSNTTALNNMGLAYMRLKKYENAVSCFKKAVELEPSFQLAKNNLNWAINELNNQ